MLVVLVIIHRTSVRTCMCVDQYTAAASNSWSYMKVGYRSMYISLNILYEAIKVIGIVGLFTIVGGPNTGTPQVGTLNY